jgi:DNA polymerase-3 subunit epsilon
MIESLIDRPLAIIDIEATGTTPRADRIVELAIVVVHPQADKRTHVFRTNPQVPIPPETSAIHGIYDQDVADCPTFADIAPRVLTILEGADLCGYNIIRYDLPMLIEEFIRAGLSFETAGRRVIDAQRIFHKKEPRDLAAALAFYCGEVHEDAHGAEADADATLKVLEGQLERYRDLPRDMQELDRFCSIRKPHWVDETGKLKWKGREVVLNFSKRKGELLRDIIENDPSFAKWMLKSNLPRDLQDIVRNAMQGKWPEPDS